MSSTVVLARAFSTSKISFSQLKSLDSGGKQAYVNYDGGKFLFQTPALSLPYDMSDKTFDPTKPIKYTAELSLRGYDEAGNKAKETYDALNALDEYMIEQGVKNSRAWFKADMPAVAVRALYTPTIKWSKDKEGNVKPYPPGVKVSLRKIKDTDNFDVKMFDANKEEYHGVSVKELLVRGAVARCVMQCTGLWVAGGKYGLSWKAVQMVMDSVPASVGGCAFVDDDDAPVEDDAAFSAPAPVPAHVSAPAPRPSAIAAVMPQLDEEDDQDESPEDVEPVPVPKKVVTTSAIKKKIVTKK
jgi:hypothetical protein